MAKENKKPMQTKKINSRKNDNELNKAEETQKETFVNEETFENEVDNAVNKDGEEQAQNKSPEQSLEEQLEILNDKYLRLSAEYDNYRKRTLKERMELIKTAGDDILINFLPAMDNIDRALKSTEEAKDIEAVIQGIKLIHKNLYDFLKDRGISEINAKGEQFNTDLHEAIVKIPTPDDSMKGKVVDVIEKGYKLKDKILRYAKVVVGE